MSQFRPAGFSDEDSESDDYGYNVKPVRLTKTYRFTAIAVICFITVYSYILGHQYEIKIIFNILNHLNHIDSITSTEKNLDTL